MSEIEAGALNPLAFLGLRRVGSENEESPVKQELDDIQLNRRGIPARKRKKNSLIFGGDEVVSIPVRSPKKKSPVKSPKKDVEKEKDRKDSSTPASVHVPLSDVKRLARLELDSLVRNQNGNLSEGEEDAESLTDMEDSYLKDEESEEEDEEEDLNELDQDIEDIDPFEQSIKQDKDDDHISILNRLNAQRLGVALRNLLKLPKAHKWVCFEFFYSNIDKILFEGENDFMVCLKESFPQLKTRRLSRVEWCKVRRLMGKPRRCSSAFFSEERVELERKRQRIRTLQQRKVLDSQSLKDLPQEIPMQLTLGTKVTARLREPQDGLFMGRVDAVDPSNHSYRINFDRPEIGTHSIPDTEVLSVEPPDSIPLSSYLNKRVKPSTGHSSFPSPNPVRYGSVHSPLTNDPLLSGSTPRTKTLRMDQILGGYPVRFLYHIVKLNKCLKSKSGRVSSLKELNSEAEKRKSYGVVISEDFQKKYAGTVLDICKINEDLNSHLKEISPFTSQLGNQEGPSLSLPDQIREHCQEKGYEMVNRYNTAPSPRGQKNHKSEQRGQDAGGQTVQSARMLDLITQLSALMLQLKRVADGERNAAEMQALKDSIEKVQIGLQPENNRTFQDNVEVHMQHIQQGLSQVGNLTAFMKTDKSESQ